MTTVADTLVRYQTISIYPYMVYPSIKRNLVMGKRQIDGGVAESDYPTTTVDLFTRLGYHQDMNMTETTDRLAPATETGSAAAPLAPSAETAKRTSTSYAHDKAKILARLRRMEGQVRGVQRMVEEDQYCLDVLTQLSAVIAAARQTGLLVLEDHVRGCVMGDQGEDTVDREELLSELIGAIDRFNRSVG